MTGPTLSIAARSELVVANGVVVAVVRRRAGEVLEGAPDLGVAAEALDEVGHVGLPQQAPQLLMPPREYLQS